MWRSIRLSALGVIDEAELEFAPGFTVITGETGAGKTMLVTALGLLRGERADLGLVRHGAAHARVEAVVDLPPGSALGVLVVDAGGVIEDDELLLGRVLSAQGRSRAFAGGAGVPAAMLAAMCDELIAVHGQSDQHRLLRAAEQRAALDSFAGAGFEAAMAQFAPGFARLRAIDRHLDELRTHAQDRAREADLLAYGLHEIDSVDPQPGEDADLSLEEGRLSHADALATAAQRAHEALAGGELDGDAARALVAAALGSFGDVRGHDPALDELAARTAEVGILLDDVSTDLSSYASNIERDPGRLAAVQERQSALNTLLRKYGPTLADVLSWREVSTARLAELGDGESHSTALLAERATLEPALVALAQQLSTARHDAAGRLGALVSAELGALSMPHATLTIAVSPRADGTLTSSGCDEVEFLFAANNGMSARPLHKGASGGELARLMLALEVVLVDKKTVPTLVFDEVDAGIGGKAAVEVGRRLARLAEHTQVLAVTHLPQVAAFADHHFHVRKDDDGFVTSSSVLSLTGAARVDELARMLAGQDDSATAQAHARELLEMAHGSGQK